MVIDVLFRFYRVQLFLGVTLELIANGAFRLYFVNTKGESGIVNTTTLNQKDKNKEGRAKRQMAVCEMNVGDMKKATKPSELYLSEQRRDDKMLHCISDVTVQCSEKKRRGQC